MAYLKTKSWFWAKHKFLESSKIDESLWLCEIPPPIYWFLVILLTVTGHSLTLTQTSHHKATEVSIRFHKSLYDGAYWSRKAKRRLPNYSTASTVIHTKALTVLSPMLIWPNLTKWVFNTVCLSDSVMSQEGVLYHDDVRSGSRVNIFQAIIYS